VGFRTRLGGELRAEDAGTRVTVAGWVARRRDHGGLVFVDLRDRAGIVQLVLDPDQGQAHAAAHDLRNEYVVQAEGVVTPRSAETVNPKLPTGEVEIRVDRLEVLSAASVLPFQLDEENVDETLRLHHRYLDLRRDVMRRNLWTRFRLTQIIRRKGVAISSSSSSLHSRANSASSRPNSSSGSMNAISMSSCVNSAVRSARVASSRKQRAIW